MKSLACRLLRARPVTHQLLRVGTFRSFSDNIQSSSLKIELTKTPKEKEPKETLKFGQSFSDHMLEIDYDIEKGWHTPVIRPYGNFSISPAASVFHYALECFEGMKAYLDGDGKIRLFRPDMNMERMNSSAARLALPPIDGDEFLECIKKLVAIDKSWIPMGTGYSMYIRPTYISTHPFVGVTPAQAAKLYCILSPVGPYYPSGFAPVKLLADPQSCRAWPGGTGNIKCGGNYALSIKPGMEAVEKGYSQILWLFGDELEVTEVGTMNQFFFWTSKEGKKELITAPLDGTILPGVTRDSILQLCREWGEFDVVERKYTLTEVIEAVEEGRMIEAFGAGTAAIVSSVNGFKYLDTEYAIPLDANDPEAKAGPLTKRVYDTLMDIQYGKVDHEWSVKIEEFFR